MTTMHKMLTKTLTSGKTVEIYKEDARICPKHEVFVDGVSGGRTSAPHTIMVAGKPVRAILWGKNPVQLTSADEAAINASLTAHIVTRDSLYVTYKGLCAEQDGARERAHDAEDYSFQASKYAAEIAAAWQAVKDYDAAHPAEVAALETERAESLRRFNAAD